MPPPKCKVCCNNYDNDEHYPLLLPCSRTLCRSCIVRVLEGGRSMRCPVCYGNHDSVNVDRLNVNHDILDYSAPPSVVDTHTRTSVTPQGNTIQIILMTLEGTKYTLKVPASATISQVKGVIREKHGFDPTTTRLLFNGRALKDDQTLTYYRVKEGSKLQMLTNYRGGYLRRYL